MKFDLIIYPTSRALRQKQRRELEKSPFFDGRRHISLSAFLGGCEEAARLSGLLHDSSGRPLARMDDLKGGIAVVEAAERFVTSPPLPIPVLGHLSRRGVEETLEQLIKYISPLADRADKFLIILEDRGSSQNRELAALYRVYRNVCEDLGVADLARINGATLALLEGEREKWPAFLRSARSVLLAGVRWVGPFVELVVRVLESDPDPVPVTISHILEEHEQDWWGRELMTGAGHLIFGREERNETGGEEDFEQSTREALDRLREGYAMLDPALAGKARFHLAFSTSVGRYGEAEDLARRIVWETKLRSDPIRPEDICIVARDIGSYADPIRSVFLRFGIPFYFRRGLPVLSAPVVKVILGFLNLSATGSREAFCSLLESPWPDWTDIVGGPDKARRLADDIRRSGVEPRISSERELKTRLSAYYRQRPPGGAGPALLIAAAERAWRKARGPAVPGRLREAIADLFRRLGEEFHLETGQRELADASAGRVDERWSYLFNARAYAAVLRALELLRDSSLLRRETSWREIYTLVVRALDGLSVFPLPPDESGVWILSPHDIGGLRFKVVIIADLTSGSFPRLPLESPIFSDQELEEFRRLLGDDLSPSSLSTSRVRSSQENLLFLTTLAASTGRIVVSAAARDEQGREITPSVFFSTLWRLAGWPAFKDELPELPPDPYDNYRLSSGVDYIRNHWELQSAPGLHSGERSPFPGESFAGTVPLSLSVTAAERRRAIVRNPAAADAGKKIEPDLSTESVAHGLKVELLRDSFFQRQAEKEDETEVIRYLPEEARYSGALGGGVLTSRKDPGTPREFTTTELEKLVACPYAFSLERIMKIREVETNELEPSARDHGAAIHRILELGFLLLRGEEREEFPDTIREIGQRYKFLHHPARVIREGEGWMLARGPESLPSAAGAIPLVCIEGESAEDRDQYLRFFSELADAVLDRAGEENWILGVKEELPIERRRIIHAVRRIVSLNFSPPKYSKSDITNKNNVIRTTALVEFAFGGREAASPPVTLADPDDSDRKIAVRGKIDRVDLIFRDDRLAAVVVIDYKGASKANITSTKLAAEITAGLDCQLPLYGLAARNYFGEDIPVIMQYLAYTSRKKDLESHARNHWISLNKEPLTEAQWKELYPEPAAELTEPLLRSIFRALDRVESGEFLIDPAHCGNYCSFKTLCRYLPGVLSVVKEGEVEG
ncbi:MAG: PD-(D/E)XK nuclease family protein [Candidatus Auribacterota bacterium]|nr:PD-(D/E)XK nuclease family protein [Candidatus Auribacterota bacterium]